MRVKDVRERTVDSARCHFFVYRYRSIYGIIDVETCVGIDVRGTTGGYRGIDAIFYTDIKQFTCRCVVVQVGVGECDATSSPEKW